MDELVEPVFTVTDAARDKSLLQFTFGLNEALQVIATDVPSDYN